MRVREKEVKNEREREREEGIKFFYKVIANAVRCMGQTQCEDQYFVIISCFKHIIRNNFTKLSRQ